MRACRINVVVFLIIVCARGASAQTASLRIEVRHDGAPIGGASVVVNGETMQTRADGVATIVVAPGNVQTVVVKEGFEPQSVSVEVRPGETRTLTIDLEPQTAVEEHVTVAATRTDKRIEDQPMRVEVLDRDEIEEKVMMTPGDIVMMLNEMGGLRVQATSPSLGAASIRIQGMKGRYTRFLSDGLPLFGEQVGSFGLLQIPPTDLAQVEVIKGVASSLYGAGAMGGVVNLVSKRPTKETEREAVANRSSRGATDGVFWYSAPIDANWGATLLASGHGQEHTDVNDDGWADLPKYARGVIRPRVFWDNHAGGTFFATTGVTIENRSGGTMPGAALPATGSPYLEQLNTRRFDAGAARQTLINQQYVVSIRGSFAHQTQDHTFGDVQERDAHDTAFVEATLRRAIGRQTLVAGAALERDAFRPDDLPRFAYTFTVPGVFAQDDVQIATWLSASASARVDIHSEFGAFVSPRVSALMRAGEWSSRVSVGRGFFAPTPLTEETEAAGLTRLAIPTMLRAERSTSASIDLTRTAGPLSTTVTFFASRISDPVEVDRSTALVLRNLDAPATNTGVELLSTWRRPPFSATASYTYVRSVEQLESQGPSVEIPLTPRHGVSLVGMWEREKIGRVGLEWYYTGVQRLEANPYRDESRPYILFGALVERRVGRYRLFINAENLANVKQTDWDPLLRSTRGVDGRWTVDAWAPLDGRNINGGVRVAF
ncbi:MAG: TonB-dependent receptor [Acidobacteria bacterium]|nr:TonB-dependent receptor [Acidobacteriota bacterium]